MRERLLRWVAWSVTFSALPYLFSAVAGALSGQDGTSDRLFGSGQLLLTAVALLGAALREVAALRTVARLGSREVILCAGALTLVCAAFLYGCQAYSAAQTPPTTNDPQVAMQLQRQHDHQQQQVRDFVAASSYGFLAMALLLGGTSVALATPIADDQATTPQDNA